MRLLSEENLDHFRCYKCSSVLSRGPIYSGFARAPLCGRCWPSQTDLPNPPLEAFLRTYVFPCRYRDNGCEEILPFNDMIHEEECRFKDGIKSPFEIIDESVWRYWKCSKCRNRLSVGPVYLDRVQRNVCGRCADFPIWDQSHIRNWKLEYILKKASFPCLHSEVGCERILTWGEVRKHENFCPHRKHSCPATPHDVCGKSNIPGGELYTHFEQKHAENLLTDLKFRENLDQDSDTNRLVRIGSSVVLLMSKIRVNKSRMWFRATLLSDINKTPQMPFSFKITKQQDKGDMSFNSEIDIDKPRKLYYDSREWENEENVISICTEGIKYYFGVQDLQEITCSLSIEWKPPNVESLETCKWNGCKAFGTEIAIKRHETICDKGVFLCEIYNCEKAYTRGEMEQHKSQHEGKGKNCRFPDCGAKPFQIPNWNDHILSCRHRFSDRFLSCDVCSGGVGNLPQLLTKHLLSEHPNNICEGPNWKTTMKKEKNDRIYFQYDGLLFQGHFRFELDRKIWFQLVLISEEDELSSDYKYTFTLIHPKYSQKTITFEKELNKEYYIWSDIVKPFMKINSITIEVKIIKK